MKTTMRRVLLKPERKYRCKILGKYWTLRFLDGRKMPGADGLCTDPNKPGREILIRENLADPRRLDTLLHEALHCSAWHIDEDFVTEFATDVARLLWRLGYRRQFHEKKKVG